MPCLSSPATSKWAAPRVARPREVVGLGRGPPQQQQQHQQQQQAQCLHPRLDVDMPIPYYSQAATLGAQEPPCLHPNNRVLARSYCNVHTHPGVHHLTNHHPPIHHHMHRCYEEPVPTYPDAQRQYQDAYSLQTPMNKSTFPMAPPSLSESFAPLKSPMSQCIDTIIGAAEVVNRSDNWVDHQRSYKQQQDECALLSNQVKPARNNKNHPPDGEAVTSNATIMEQVDEIEAILQDPDFYRTLTLTMALERPRKADKATKRPPNVIGEGFYWKEYPELEDVLYSEMHQYYKYSANSRQSRHQQAYNNALVENVKQVASQYGYEFDAMVYSDKKLRDRIRCFYKTHLQNAKKRLQTLQKHIVGPEQRRSLHALIQKAKAQPAAAWISSIAPIYYSSEEEEEAEDNDEALSTQRKRRRCPSTSE